MATKQDFSQREWQLIAAAPYWVQAAIRKAEGRMGLVEKQKEVRAIQFYLRDTKTDNALIQAILDAKADKSDVDEKLPLEEIGDKLEQVAAAVSRKVSDREFDQFTDFLLGAGTAIAEASGEGLIKAMGDKVSDEEAEALDLIATALKAGEDDRQSRAEARLADRRKALEEKRKAAAAAKAATAAAEAKKLKEAEAAAQKAEADAKVKREAAKKKAKERAERQARLREKKQAYEKARAAAEAKREAEAAAAAEAEAAKEVFYEVQPGDNLSFIARDVLGNANRWKEIYEANKDVIKNPSLIYPGQKLRIPQG